MPLLRKLQQRGGGDMEGVLRRVVVRLVVTVVQAHVAVTKPQAA